MIYQHCPYARTVRRSYDLLSRETYMVDLIGAGPGAHMAGSIPAATKLFAFFYNSAIIYLWTILGDLKSVIESTSRAI